MDITSELPGRPALENDEIVIIQKIDFTVDEGKEWLNPTREKNQGTHRRREVGEKSCVTFLLCDPGWYVQRTSCPE